MKKEVVLECRSTPDVDGYPDTLLVCIDNHLRYACDAGACPNGPTGKWGWLAPCETKFECVPHHKYGKCLLLNNGGKLPSRVANHKYHGGNFIVNEIFVHCGDSATNRGSRACPTVHPVAWPALLEYLELWDMGTFTIVDVSKPDADKQRD